MHRAIGRHVLRDHRAAGDESQPADAGELVHAGEAAEDDPVLDHHMSAERGAVGEHAVVAELDVVGDVAVRHHQAAVPDAGHTAAPRRAEVHGDEFAELVAVPDHHLGGLAGVLEVLRNGADGGEMEDDVVRAHRRVAFDDGVRPDPRARPDLHLRSDDRVRTHFDRGVQLGVPIDDGSRMDHGVPFRSAMLAIISASLASWPSTFASAARRQMGPFWRSTRTWRSRRSPGITTRRNFTLSNAMR